MEVCSDKATGISETFSEKRLNFYYLKKFIVLVSLLALVSSLQDFVLSV